MYSQVSATFFLGLAALVSAGPVANVDTDVAMAKRGGSHTATLFDSESCVGNTVGSFQDFGCGGTCHPVNNAHSILLNQATTGNPKPTASLFSDSNCQNQVGSAGIFSGQNAGCTNEGTAVNSVFLFFNC
ncbi:hypothetical protein HD806DRAFT_510653 [Xylariaceae sp. AK1471]|nr:hypothetical protein HD806DRAFT_510653 [Xylariaceae sp. AK1471]